MNRISHFNGDVENWTYSSENKEHNNRFQYISNLINYDFSCKLDISSRIGSASTMGEVYKINIDIHNINYVLAAKILPILSDKSFKSNENEIRLAVEASESVLKGESAYFPIVYGFNECEETYFYGKSPNNLNFYERSLRYQQFQYLYSSITSKELKNKVMEFKKSLKSPELVLNYLQSKEKNLKLSLPTKVSSHLLFSELASYDMNFYLETYRLSFEDICDILQKIFKAIQDLHMKLNILHNDLHLGNILILEEIENDSVIETPLIHDFGSSEKLDFSKITQRERAKDINYFMSQFWDKISTLYSESEPQMFKKLKIMFNEIDDVILESNKIYPIQDVVEYFENFKE
jgi:hypothetical protein